MPYYKSFIPLCQFCLSSLEKIILTRKVFIYHNDNMTCHDTMPIIENWLLQLWKDRHRSNFMPFFGFNLKDLKKINLHIFRFYFWWDFWRFNQPRNLEIVEIIRQELYFDLLNDNNLFHYVFSDFDIKYDVKPIFDIEKTHKKEFYQISLWHFIRTKIYRLRNGHCMIYRHQSCWKEDLNLLIHLFIG